MNPLAGQPLFCPRCGAHLEPTDRYCHFCGRSLRPGYGFLFTHPGILLMTLLVGPFALPLVWKSRVLSRAAQWVYTAILVLLGLYLVRAVGQVIHTLRSSLQLFTSL